MYTPSARRSSDPRTNTEVTSIVRLTVDGVIHPGVQLVNPRAKRFGIEVELSLVFGQEVVERGVEDPNDLRALVVHDRFCLLVP